MQIAAFRSFMQQSCVHMYHDVSALPAYHTAMGRISVTPLALMVWVLLMRFRMHDYDKDCTAPVGGSCHALHWRWRASRLPCA